MKRLTVVLLALAICIGATAAPNMALPDSQYTLRQAGTWTCSHDYWVSGNGQVIGPATSAPPAESLVDIAGGSVTRGYLLQRQICSCTAVEGSITATRVLNTFLYAVPEGTGAIWYPREGVIYRQLVRVTACYNLNADGTIKAQWHWLLPAIGISYLGQ